MEKLFIGSDHAGFELKEKVKEFLSNSGYEVEDLGNKVLDKDDDYPDYAVPVAKKAAEGNKGILVCGSGHGVCIAANKVKGARAVFVKEVEEAKYTRQHNDSNVLCLSGWKADFENIKKILTTWLTTEFSKEERHHRRIEKIKDLEK